MVDIIIEENKTKVEVRTYFSPNMMNWLSISRFSQSVSESILRESDWERKNKGNKVSVPIQPTVGSS